MSDEFILSLLILITGLLTEKTFSMKRDRNEIGQKPNIKQEKGPAKKNIKIDEEDNKSLRAFFALSEEDALQILQDLPYLSQLFLSRKIEEKLSQRSEFGTISIIPDEIKEIIISDYLLLCLSNKIKSIYSIDKFIKTLPLALVNKRFRELSLDPLIKLPLLKKLVQKFSDQAIDYLIRSTETLNLEMVQNLIKAGTNVNGIGISFRNITDIFSLEEHSHNITPLEVVVNYNDDDNKESAVENNHKRLIKITRALLEAGANPDLTSNDESDETPLFSLVKNEKIRNEETKDKMVLMLLKAGADADLVNENDWNIIDEASSKNYGNIIKYLMDYGADPFIYAINEFSKTIIQNHSHSKLLFILIKMGDIERLTPLIEQPQLKLPNFDINVKDENGYTALMFAVTGHWSYLVTYLLEHKANPNVVARDGKTALSIAESIAIKNENQQSENSNIIKTLKTYGAK